VSAETTPAYRTGRSYTRARRMPWVVGKIQGVSLPFGPYTATQLAVLLGGGWMLVQTFRLWSHLGPAGLLVLVFPPAAAWAVRHAKIEGRSPVRAAAGFLALLTEPQCGRIGGHLARDHRPVTLKGRIRIATVATTPAHVTEASPAEKLIAPAAKPRFKPFTASVPAPTALQTLLAGTTAQQSSEAVSKECGSPSGT
jgi:hypothetical protein